MNRPIFRPIILALIMITPVTACGNKDLHKETHFISWNNNSVRSSLIGKSLEPEIKICIDGSMNSTDLNRVRDWAKKATLTWLRIAKLMDDRVTGKIQFSCQNYHLALHIRRGEGTSFASPSVSTIYLSRPFGTWTHEFGHALAGLSDTYSGRTAGDCLSGQPESLMCWGAYGPRKDDKIHSTLWVDDIQGFQTNFHKIFGQDTTAPDWADTIDPEGPLDLSRPWPNYSNADQSPGNTRAIIDESLPTTQIDLNENTRSIDL